MACKYRTPKAVLSVIIKDICLTCGISTIQAFTEKYIQHSQGADPLVVFNEAHNPSMSYVDAIICNNNYIIYVEGVDSTTICG